MKRFFYIISVALLCGALSCPSAQAQSRGRNNGNNGGDTPTHNTQSPSRGQAPQSKPSVSTGPASQTRPAATSTQKVQTPKSNQRPAYGTQTPAVRPGNGGQGNSSVRPGNGGQGNNLGGGNGNDNASARPGHGNSNVNRPNTPNSPNMPGNAPGNKPGNKPGNNFAPGGGPHNPGHPNGPNHPGGPGHNHPGPGPAWGGIPNYMPYRPMMPQVHPGWRPTPPPVAFRPGPRYPIISTILGVTLGTAINLSLDYLFNNGYYVTGYTNDAVYLNDVTQLNLIWPNATLYYNHGRLRGSEFVYSTPYYDMTRYYNTYNRLLNAYGAPVVTNTLMGGGMECSWFGYDGQYVTLQFMSGLANNGTTRFYTTLSFGN